MVTTDKHGVYELYDVPPGRYLLEPELKFGWRVDEYYLTRPLTRAEMMGERVEEMNNGPGNRVAFTLRRGRHFGVNVSLTLSNHVTGTVYDASGKPWPGVCVSLAATDGKVDLAAIPSVTSWAAFGLTRSRLGRTY